MTIAETIAWIMIWMIAGAAARYSAWRYEQQLEAWRKHLEEDEPSPQWLQREQLNIDDAVQLAPKQFLRRRARIPTNRSPAVWVFLGIMLMGGALFYLKLWPLLPQTTWAQITLF